MNISKQTHAIVDEVWSKNPPEEWQSTYLPHGVSEQFYPINVFDEESQEVEKFRSQLQTLPPDVHDQKKFLLCSLFQIFHCKSVDVGDTLVLANLQLRLINPKM